ncbi:MAG: hypothetical protein JW742_02460 [Candidatus Aminicenantes bacterium]|nr:hypothetical protein [Candidatus Aminicenantes bacterium]
MPRCNRRCLFPLVLTLLAVARGASTQFTPDEIAERPLIEEFLATADIIGAEDIGEGVTKPIRLTLRKDGRVERGVWKNPSGVLFGHWDNWTSEIAAYRMDKLLGLNMVPPTVAREYKGKRGSLQLWATVETSLMKIIEDKIRIPDEFLERTERAKYLTRAFDSLIANEDRTQQNTLYTKDWRCILIDHSRSFLKGPEYSAQLLYGKNAKKRPLLFRRLPRAFVDRIRALTPEAVRTAVAPYLDEDAIQAVLARKILVLQEIDERIRELGEEQVLY